jgi:hypothetical protein
LTLSRLTVQVLFKLATACVLTDIYPNQSFGTLPARQIVRLSSLKGKGWGDVESYMSNVYRHRQAVRGLLDAHCFIYRLALVRTHWHNSKESIRRLGTMMDSGMRSRRETACFPRRIDNSNFTNQIGGLQTNNHSTARYPSQANTIYGNFRRTLTPHNAPTVLRLQSGAQQPPLQLHVLTCPLFLAAT